MLRRPLPLLSFLALVATQTACPTGSSVPKAPVAGPSEALDGLPARKDPELAYDDADDRERARSLYEAMPLDAPGRAESRARLWPSYQREIEAAVERSDVSGAFDAFGHAVSMWRAEEVADETQPAPGLDLVAPTATKLYAFFSHAGADREAVTALAVLRAAQPDQGAAYQSAFDAIAAYADDLEVARMGAGAERARPIKMLEEATKHFPSPWACRLLASLYLDRQAARVAALGKNDERLEGAHGPGLRYPIWSLVRAYARMGKLEQVPAILDSLAGQLGDDEQIRALVREAVSGKGKPEVFSALAEQFSQGEDEQRDLTTARRVCEAGERLYPRAVDPQFCLGITAARSGYLALAVVHIERAVERAPQDHEKWSLLGNLYVFRMRDLLQAERVDAARAELGRIEKLHADAAKKFPKKPLDPGLDELYLGFGRGLYALGEIDEALTYLKKATTQKANAEALELIALIELKRGRYADAARDFEASAALPRETPLEKKIGEARLLRLAADARAGAGDSAGARAWWKAALDKWDTVLGSGLTEGQRSEALLERGRLLWALGDKTEARRSFEAAIDSAGETTETQVYSDTIAFLFPRGEYEAALDAYHRGLARPGVTEYFKIYCSLWIVSAARLNGKEPDPLAMEFLAGREGTRWYHELARFTSGRLSWDELYVKANTRGKRAEAFFYQGMARYAAGDRAGGDKLMKLTLATDMLGFFEYDMAAFFLAQGPSGRATSAAR